MAKPSIFHLVRSSQPAQECRFVLTTTALDKLVGENDGRVIAAVRAALHDRS